MTGASMVGSGIQVRGLTRRFGAHVAVQPFELDVEPGCVTGLLGPNGSGKSTLLRMLLGLVRPHGGAASVDGVPLAGDGTRIRRRATYLPGEIGTYGELKGRDHLRWLVAGRGRDAFPRGLELARELDLPLARRVKGYSHGMKRQLLLVAALAPAVPVRVLDEPTEGLDPTARGRVLDMLRRDAERGNTVLFSSHHLGEVDRLCDRMLFLRRGELLDERSAAALRERARRAVRLSWDVAPDAQALEALFTERGAEDLRIEGARAQFFLPIRSSGEPSAELAELLRDARLPAPTTVSFGELSLRSIYRQIYGEEGV